MYLRTTTRAEDGRLGQSSEHRADEGIVSQDVAEQVLSVRGWEGPWCTVWHEASPVQGRSSCMLLPVDLCRTGHAGKMSAHGTKLSLASGNTIQDMRGKLSVGAGGDRKCSAYSHVFHASVLFVVVLLCLASSALVDSAQWDCFCFMLKLYGNVTFAFFVCNMSTHEKRKLYK
jgi:hypothetical protein